MRVHVADELMGSALGDMLTSFLKVLNVVTVAAGGAFDVLVTSTVTCAAYKHVIDNACANLAVTPDWANKCVDKGHLVPTSGYMLPPLTLFKVVGDQPSFRMRSSDDGSG